MARQHSVSELVKFAKRLEKYTIKSGTKLDTTIATTAVTVGLSTITVASPTNGADLDYITLIGQNGQADLLQISGAPAGSVITLAYKTGIAATIGSRVVEMSQVDLGHLDQSGITYTSSAQKVDVNASTSRTPLYSYMSTGTIGGSANLLEFSAENWAAAHAVPESSVFGAGTVSDPKGLLITGQTMGTEVYTVLRAVCDMGDGVTTAWVDFINCTVTPSINSQLGGSQSPSLGLTWSSTAALVRTFQ